MAEKPHMNLVFIGHVDHGKSTTIGRILYDTGAIREDEMRKLRQEAAERGKATFEFAFIMDRLKEERERGLTIDVAHKRFDTEKYYFTIIDAPGHRDFVKNMITGTSQADAAVLVVNASKGVEAQTKEHIFLAWTLGVNQLIVAISQMDTTNPPYSEQRYNEVKNDVTNLLKTVRYKMEKVQFIPISAYVGDNVVKPSDNLKWWRGETLVQCMNKFEVPEKPINKPLRLPVQDVYSITGVGTVPVGRVETGVLNIGDKIIFQPGEKTAEVKDIEMHHEKMAKAVPGDNVGFNVRGISKEEIKRGDVAGLITNPPTVAKTFIAQIAVLQHPSAITVGYTPVFHCHTAQVACGFEEIQKLIDPKTGEEVKEKEGQIKDGVIQFIKTGDIAIIKVRPTRPFVIENAKEFPQLGRFAIRDMGQTVAAGMCISVEKR